MPLSFCVLIEFAEEHKLIIANTLFQKPKNRYWTWESPDGETRNQIDLTLSNQRGIVTNCQVITKADIGSDHRLGRMTLRINKRLARLKTTKEQKPFNVKLSPLSFLPPIPNAPMLLKSSSFVLVPIFALKSPVIIYIWSHYQLLLCQYHHKLVPLFHPQH